MKTALVAVAALTLAAVPVQAQTRDEAQLVLISGINAFVKSEKTTTDVLSKVTFTMPTMFGCVEAGKLWEKVQGPKTGHRLGWRKFQCLPRW